MNEREQDERAPEDREKLIAGLVEVNAKQVVRIEMLDEALRSKRRRIATLESQVKQLQADVR